MGVEEGAPGYRLFVGVDIAATTAVAVWQAADGSATRPLTIEQTAQGFAALQRRLRATGVAPAEVLVVMEATGSYWLSLATALAEAGFAISVINAGQAHHFAKALLKRAKTDAIDARTLAQLACPGVAPLLRTLDDVVRVMEVSDAAYSPTLPAGVPRRGGAPRPGE